MQRIKFTTCLSGYNYVIKPGQEVEMDDAEAARHVVAGNAEYCPGYPKEREIESAAVKPKAETATLPPATPKTTAGIRRVTK